MLRGPSIQLVVAAVVLLAKHTLGRACRQSVPFLDHKYPRLLPLANTISEEMIVGTAMNTEQVPQRVWLLSANSMAFLGTVERSVGSFHLFEIVCPMRRRLCNSPQVWNENKSCDESS